VKKSEIYIAKIKDEDFDFDNSATWKDNYPEPLCDLVRCNELYEDIKKLVQDGAANVIKLDYFSWAVRFSKSILAEFLSKERYRNTAQNCKSVNHLIKVIETLNDDEDYLLVAIF